MPQKKATSNKFSKYNKEESEEYEETLVEFKKLFSISPLTVDHLYRMGYTSGNFITIISLVSFYFFNFYINRIIYYYNFILIHEIVKSLAAEKNTPSSLAKEITTYLTKSKQVNAGKPYDYSTVFRRILFASRASPSELLSFHDYNDCKHWSRKGLQARGLDIGENGCVVPLKKVDEKEKEKEEEEKSDDENNEEKKEKGKRTKNNKGEQKPKKKARKWPLLL